MEYPSNEVKLVRAAKLTQNLNRASAGRDP